ncbi:MAG: 23S rRNA (uracil(1939)-C(5))-methyltransferase RlmD, partial [Rikenellaceae bacterium]|nr:23S rRNA (uracil(1939)-C(5))-methyltransferase RlmD [Rikenellaceae bacterium]
MGKRRDKTLPFIEGLEITALAAEGNALGRWNEQVVFVPQAVPGDVVDVQVFSKKRRFMEGRIVGFIKRSDLRTEPVCKHFGVCGGCKWQHLPYAEQLRQKQQQVEDQLTRIGKIDLPEINPILGSAQTEFYRNKLEYSFAPRRWMTREEIAEGGQIDPGPALGFHIPGMFDKILDIEKCWLQPDPSNDIRLAVRKFCVDNGYSFYNVREHRGLMRGIMIRTASTGEVMVIVVFSGEFRDEHRLLLGHLRTSFPQITSLMYAVSAKLNDSIADVPVELHSGMDHIFEQMEGLRFKIGPKSFYQTNSAQAYELYKIVREQAALTGGEVLYDLYTGTGTIANFVAAQCSKVVGIEYVSEAIADAKVNSEINGIANTSFFAGDMKDLLKADFIDAHGRPDVVVLDPPRAGIHEDVARVL